MFCSTLRLVVLLVRRLYVNPDTLISKNNLAVVLHWQRKFDAAEQLHQETLARRQEAPGEDHPDTLTSQNYLASVRTEHPISAV